MLRISTNRALPVKVILFICLLAGLTFGFASPVSSSLGFNVILRDVQVEPVSGQLTHEVEAYVSVLDNDGAPIKNLQSSSFTLLEDSQPVQFDLKEGANTSLSLVLAMDTSYGMAGNGLARAQQASTRFISRMGENEAIAVVSFNSKVTVMSDFTNDQTAVAGSIGKLAAAPGSGTCLYEGIYKSIQMVSAQPEGQHAVLVMTDGRDEMPNSDKPCSAVTIDDIIHLATTGQNVPIYTIGVGKQIDEKSLDRLALLTGGSVLLSTDFSALDSGFDKMFDQLKDQYVLTYGSKAASGEHSLSVQVNIGSEKDEDRRAFLITEALPIVTIVSPMEGQTLNEKTTVAVNITGQKDAVARIAFQINDQPAGQDDSYPFELALDPAAYAAGSIEISATALDSSGKVLGNSTVRANIPVLQLPTPTLAVQVETAAAPAAVEFTPAPSSAGGGNSSMLLILGGGAGLVIVLVVLGLVMVKPFGKNKQAAPYQPAAPQAFPPSSGSEATYDGAAPGALAELTVLFSDDSSRIGERITITQMVTSFGRGTTNDISFPNDHPVSRKHMLLEQRAGKFWVSEILSETGSGMKPPTFGTFVNDQKLAGNPVSLKSGDAIRLGSRLNLAFQSFLDQPGHAADNEPTMDEADDATID